MKAKNFLYVILFQILTLSIVHGSVLAVLGTVPLERNANKSFIPKYQKETSEILISRDQYLLSYNKKSRLLNWAEWKVEASDLGDIVRTNSFALDTELEGFLNHSNEHAVSLKDYKGSCFDRGHQVPSGDRTDSVENNLMTFSLSNMTPQTAYLNRVLWKNLEVYTRDLIKNHNKKVYIIAGPIFDEDYGFIGVNKDIKIPSKSFKVIIVLNSDQTLSDVNCKTEIISVVMPNRLKSGKKPLEDQNELCTNVVTDTAKIATTNDWQQYKTTLEEVERLSGFKLLPFKIGKKVN